MSTPLVFTGRRPPPPAPSSSSQPPIPPLSQQQQPSTSASESSTSHVQWSASMARQLEEMLATEKKEVLLMPNPDRFIIFPIQYPILFKHYENHHAMEWVLAEVTEIHKDQLDFKNASAGVQRMVSQIMAFFAASDGIVAENLAARFMKEIQIPEARLFYGVQLKMENIHALTYQTLLISMIESEEQRKKLLNAARTFPSVKAKAEWAMQWIDNEKMPFAVRLFAFAIVEGIFFSSSFCCIYWLKGKGIFPATCKSNEWIARDEGLHTAFAIELYNMLVGRIPENVVLYMLQSAVQLEQRFVEDILSTPLIGITSKSMSQYVEFMADRLLVQAQHKKHYQTHNPFEWMDRIGMKVKQNFHEDNVAEYTRRVSVSKQAITFGGGKRKVQK